MASSIQQLREALEIKNEVAMKATEIAIENMNWTLNMSMFVLTVVGLVFAGVAVAGWWSIHTVSKRRAERIANISLKSYLESDKFTTMVDDKIKLAAEEKLQRLVFVRELEIPNREAADEAPFPDVRDGEQ